ncbi:MAG: hypothetical protein U1F57_03720 [bacterium]
MNENPAVLKTKIWKTSLPEEIVRENLVRFPGKFDRPEPMDLRNDLANGGEAADHAQSKNQRNQIQAARVLD